MHLNFLKPLRRIRVLSMTDRIGSALRLSFRNTGLHSLRALLCTKYDGKPRLFGICIHRPAFVFVSSDSPSQDKRKYNMFLIWYDMKKVWSSLRCRCFDSQNCKISKPPFLPSFINAISWRYHNLFLLTLYISRRHGEQWQDIDRT